MVHFSVCGMDDDALFAETQMLDSMVEMQRLIARTQAELAQAMAEFTERRQCDRLLAEFAADEIAVALSLSRPRVLERLRLVCQLRAGLPATWAAWRAGSLDEFKVAKIAAAAEELADPATVGDFEAAAAAAAPAKTWGQLQSWLNRKVALAGPKDAETRYRRAFTRRRVETSRTLDGMGWLWATTDALELTAVDHRFTTLAQQLGADDARSMDQRRADILIDLLMGRSSQSTGGGQSSVVVGVTVPVQSLVGRDDTPGMLADGSAAVPASVVREVAARPGTLFYRLLTDGRGKLLDVTELGRFPSKLLGFAVDARDQSCRFPGCRRAATGCDCDHTLRHPDGATSYVNLGCLCRRHHRCKQTPGYAVQQVEAGVFEWRMPTGHRHTVRPDPLPVGRWPDEPEPDEPDEPDPPEESV